MSNRIDGQIDVYADSRGIEWRVGDTMHNGIRSHKSGGGEYPKIGPYAIVGKLPGEVIGYLTRAAIKADATLVRRCEVEDLPTPKAPAPVAIDPASCDPLDVAAAVEGIRQFAAMSLDHWKRQLAKEFIGAVSSAVAPGLRVIYDWSGRTGGPIAMISHPKAWGPYSNGKRRMGGDWVVAWTRYLDGSMLPLSHVRESVIAYCKRIIAGLGAQTAASS